MKWRWARSRELKELTERRQERADSALEHSERVAAELDIVESQFLASIERLRQLNRENNFGPKMRQVYGRD